MKRSKRLLALLLAFTLALGLVAPAMAQEEPPEEPNPAAEMEPPPLSPSPKQPSFFQRAGSALQSIGSVLGSIFIGIPLFILVWGGFFGTFGLIALGGFFLNLPNLLFQWAAGLFR